MIGSHLETLVLERKPLKGWEFLGKYDTILHWLRKINVHFVLVNALLVLCVRNKMVYYTYNAQLIVYK